MKIKQNSFTLLELICVMAISLLVIGTVIGRVGKTPAFLSFNNCVNKIQGVLSEGSNQSLLNGKNIVIEFADNKFYPKNQKNFKDRSQIKKYITYTLPDSVTIKFSGESVNNKIDFNFFPDGTTSGPEIYLTFKGHSATIRISKLTGIVTTQYDT